MRINNQDLINKMKFWEKQINDYLKSEGIEPISLFYGNRIYPKISFLLGNEKKQHIKIKSIWINERNKPFIQLWYVHHS